VAIADSDNVVFKSVCNWYWSCSVNMGELTVVCGLWRCAVNWNCCRL